MFAVAVAVAAEPISGAPSLLGGFLSPTREDHPSMWVFNLGEASPRDVITHDLEEFAKVGISSFTMIGNSENPFKKDHALMPSGLYGPVRVLAKTKEGKSRP